jgi:hypothetical protein
LKLLYRFHVLLSISVRIKNPVAQIVIGAKFGLGKLALGAGKNTRDINLVRTPLSEVEVRGVTRRGRIR